MCDESTKEVKKSVGAKTKPLRVLVPLMETGRPSRGVQERHSAVRPRHLSATESDVVPVLPTAFGETD